jgi:hypothetical protein
MSYEIDEILFNSLAGRSPSEVCQRTGCRYDQAGNSYYLSYWGDEYLVNCRRKKIDRLTSNFSKPHDYVPVFIINYLMQVKNLPLTGQWISEKDMPGGVTFFRGPHEIPTRMIASRFSNDLGGFARSCERLDGRPLSMADAAYAFNPAPHLAIALLYWLGDEEFAPEAKLLFDKSMSGTLALDTVYALAVDACSRVSRS